MRPLELVLEGFTSFRTKQTIDFTELDLFAITGATGAGKSSLLDALTFALYGSTMRAGVAAAEVVSQGAKQMSVSLRFRSRGHEYRCTRTWRERGKSAPESKALFEQAEAGGWKLIASGAREAGKQVETVLGMDFDTFTRVIVLPQGQFDKFLKGEPAQRQELLRQLAGLQIYERMREAARERHVAAAHRRQEFEERLAGLEVPDEAEVAAKQQALAAQEAALPPAQEAVARARRALEDAEKLLAELRRLAGLRSSLAALLARATELADLEARLARAREADKLAAPFERLGEARQRSKRADEGRQEAAARLEAASAAGRREAERYADTRARHDAAQPRLREREHRLLEARGLEEHHRRASEELASAEEQARRKAAAAQQAEATRKEKLSALLKAETALAAADVALAKEQAGGERLVALTCALPLLKAWGLADRRVQEARARRERDRAALVTARAEATQAEDALAEAERTLAEARAAFEAKQQAIAAHTRHQHAAILQQGLRPGDDCPVCGAAVTTLPELPGEAPGDARAEEAVVQAADQATRRCQQQLAGAAARLEAAGEKAAEADTDAREAEELVEEANHALYAFLPDASWDAPALEAEHAALTRADAAYQAATERRRAAEAAVAPVRQALAFTGEALEAAKAAAADATAVREARLAEAREVDAAWRAITGGEPCARLLEALEAERQALSRALEAARQAHDQAQAAVLTAAEAERQASATAAEATAALHTATEAWGAALAAAGFDEPTFLQARATSHDQDRWQATLDEHGRERARLEAQVEEVERGVAGRAIDEAAIAALRTDLAGAEAALEALQRERLALHGWLATAESRRAQAAAWAADLTPLREQERVLAVLKEELGSRKFQAYMLEYLQADLVERASVILRELSDERYALRLQEGQFHVEDFWNGGELRKVRTLSGGETFAASLSMALALSEKLAMGAELGSLFLDEGFGTLDAETLEAVTQILESLRQQHRMIGVITHVRALAERLPTQLVVRKTPAGSSVTIESA